MNTKKYINKYSLSFITIIIIILLFLNFIFKGALKYKDEIINEIDYVEIIDLRIGKESFDRYKKSSIINKKFIEELRGLYTKEIFRGEEIQRQLYYYSITAKIFYVNGLIGKVEIEKDKTNNFYFVTYNSKNVRQIYPKCHKDENNQFQEVVDYIIEHGERVD